MYVCATLMPLYPYCQACQFAFMDASWWEGLDRKIEGNIMHLLLKKYGRAWPYKLLYVV